MISALVKLHNFVTTAKQVAMVWALCCDWVKKCMEYEMGGSQIQEVDQRGLE